MAFTVNVTGETLVPIKYLTSFILGKSLLYAGESPYFPYNPSFMLEKSFVFAWENSCLAPESHQSRLQCLVNLKKPCQSKCTKINPVTGGDAVRIRQQSAAQKLTVGCRYGKSCVRQPLQKIGQCHLNLGSRHGPWCP